MPGDRSHSTASRSGVRIRQRLQQQRVDDAEDRGVGADPDAERRDDDEGQPRASSQRAHGVANVLEKGGHHVYPAVKIMSADSSFHHALDCVDHQQCPDGELDQIPVEDPVSITGGSGPDPHR